VRTRAIIATFAVLAVFSAIGVAIWKLSSPTGIHLPVPLPSDYCTAGTNGQVTLTLDQMANAATITAVGIRRDVPERAVTVALATALQESKLTNLDGGDRDSVGLFQQRPSQGWGTAAQISDPRYAAGKFYAALLHVPNWSRLTITEAAQAVQHSSFPGAYEKWSTDAQVLSAALMGDKSAAVTCSISDKPSSRGPKALDDLTSILRHDWGSRTPAVRPLTPDSLSLAVAGTKSGWQYAHWLVAHASQANLQRVQFGGLAWTASAGTWKPVPKPSPRSVTSDVATTPVNAVIAQVYAAGK
jgi:hypothetical protein